MIDIFCCYIGMDICEQYVKVILRASYDTYSDRINFVSVAIHCLSFASASIIDCTGTASRRSDDSLLTFVLSKIRSIFKSVGILNE